MKNSLSLVILVILVILVVSSVANATPRTIVFPDHNVVAGGVYTTAYGGGTAEQVVEAAVAIELCELDLVLGNFAEPTVGSARIASRPKVGRLVKVERPVVLKLVTPAELGELSTRAQMSRASREARDNERRQFYAAAMARSKAKASTKLAMASPTNAE